LHRQYFGDSYDLVKRFFVDQLRLLGYRIYADPMFTPGGEVPLAAYYRLLGVPPLQERGGRPARSALFVDPDTGVRSVRGRKHVSFEGLASAAKDHAIVFCFDQAFSRGSAVMPAMQDKLAHLARLGCAGMYFSSHAQFLFLSTRSNVINQLRSHLIKVGLPAARLVQSGT
jgi:hypothetical protein